MTRLRKRMSGGCLVWCVVAVLARAASAGDEACPAAQRSIDASTIVLRLPDEMGAPERPAVEFKHGLHVEKLEEEGCEACHALDAQGGLIPKLAGMAEALDPDSLRNLYHDTCIGCHETRADQKLEAGPVTCGECHVKVPAPVSVRQPMGFDYSLHYRHVAAADEKCAVCHHAYNEEDERACLRCHGDKEEGDKPSLKDASHSSCVACHLQRRQKRLEAGPVSCDGCHAPGAREMIDVLAEIPRLMGGQKDQVWITGPGAKGRMVPFDHQAHETRAGFCTECHRRGVGACKECHTLAGELTLVTAFHLPTSDDTCVGCHASRSRNGDCAGCHPMPGSLPGERTCDRCHSGPLAQTPLTPAASAVPETPSPAEQELALLPVASDDFPNELAIGTLVDDFKPAEMPHAKIVARLDSTVRGSKLATHFHGQTETLCAGCHHHSPVGERPTPCGSCHGEENEAAHDKPSLKVAYHRQCIGCHQRIGIEKQGCTDCHAETPEEVRP